MILCWNLTETLNLGQFAKKYYFFCVKIYVLRKLRKKSAKLIGLHVRKRCLKVRNFVETLTKKLKMSLKNLLLKISVFGWLHYSHREKTKGNFWRQIFNFWSNLFNSFLLLKQNVKSCLMDTQALYFNTLVPGYGYRAQLLDFNLMQV